MYKSIIRSIIVTIVFICAIKVETIHAQNEQKDGDLVTGRVITQRKEEPVKFANVVNISTDAGTVTDTLGFFKIRLHPKDTLKLSCMGYITKYITPEDSLYEHKFQEITFARKYHEIDEVTVPGWTWESFKKEFLEMEPEKKKKDYGLDTLVSDYDKAAQQQLKNAPDGVGIAVPLNLTSDAEKQRQKVEELRKQDAKDEVIREKFNNQILREVTGLEGEELTEFVLYAQFSDRFLYNASSYYVINEIKRRYKRFKKMKKASEPQDSVR